MNPIVSVVVATYRRDTVLSRALESLATQTYRNFEIVLVDDNGEQSWNDKVRTIVDSFQKKNPETSIRYIVNEANLGSAQTRNEGISVSQGEYVCFLDDDDIYLPNKIKNQLIAMQKENADYSITDLALFSESEVLIQKRKREYIKDATKEQLLKYHLMYHITGTDTMMFRREYLIDIGGFSPINVGDEFYLMKKAIKNGGKFLYVPVCDVKAYIHTGEGGMSSGQGKIDGENLLFKHKQKYFEKLDAKSIRYIKMRHYAVLAFAYLRCGKYINFFFECIKSFLCSPLSFFKILFLRLFYKK